MATATSRPPGLRGYDARWSDATGTALVLPDGSAQWVTPVAGVTASAAFKRRIGLALGGIWNATLPSPPPIILFKGDSTFSGTKTAGLDHIDGRKNSFVAQLAKALTAAGLPATHEAFLGGRIATTLAEYNEYDPRVSIGAGWSIGGPALGVIRFFTTGSNPIAFTPTTSFDRILVMYTGYSGAGTFDINVDGGANIATTDTNGADRIGLAVFSVAAGTHTINLTRASGTVQINGMAVWNSTERGLMLINGSAGGATTTVLANDVASYSNLNGAGYLLPIATVLSQGINDMYVGTAVATIKANLQLQITEAKTTGECILVTPPPLELTTFTNQVALEIAYAELAEDNDCALISSRDIFSTSAIAYADGLMVADEIHPSISGTGVWVQRLVRALMSWAAAE